MLLLFMESLDREAPLLVQGQNTHMRYREILLALVLSFLGLSACARECSEPPSSESAADLDRLRDLHDYVFVARVERVTRRGVLADDTVPETAELFVYAPALKGDVPETISFDRRVPCSAEFTEGAVYLMFLNDLSATPFRSEVRLVLATEAGPGVGWILDWIGGAP